MWVMSWLKSFISTMGFQIGKKTRPRQNSWKNAGCWHLQWGIPWSIHTRSWLYLRGSVYELNRKQLRKIKRTCLTCNIPTHCLPSMKLTANAPENQGLKFMTMVGFHDIVLLGWPIFRGVCWKHYLIKDPGTLQSFTINIITQFHHPGAFAGNGQTSMVLEEYYHWVILFG